MGLPLLHGHIQSDLISDLKLVFYHSATGAKPTSSFLATLQHCLTSLEKKYPASPTLKTMLLNVFSSVVEASAK
jgi:hypothetical protein